MLSIEPSLRRLSLPISTSYGGSQVWFYWSEALLVSRTRENLEFLEIQGQWDKLDREEDRYAILGPLPFHCSKGSVLW